MRELLITCDICGKRIADFSNRPIIIGIDRDGNRMLDETEYCTAYKPKFDLCEDCTTGLIDVIEGFVEAGRQKNAPKPKPKPKQEPDPKPTKKRKPIDKGKVKALHEAGWSAAKIADEMGCSSANIYLILKGD